MDDTEGTLRCFETAAATVAWDGSRGSNGVDTEALLAHLPATGRRIHEARFEVRKAVKAKTKGEQVPWEHRCLRGDGYPAGPGRPVR